MALGEPTTIEYHTADATILATGSTGTVFSVVLLPGTLGLAQLDLKIGGSAGTVIFHMEAALGVSAPVWTTGAPNCGALFSDGIYANITGTGAAYMIEWTTL